MDACVIVMHRVALITVHGTFAKAASWVRSESVLLRRVRADLERRGHSCDVFPFPWSGANTFAARRQAGADLAKFVESHRSGYDELFVIAHSHGGSVFAYAVSQEPSLKQKVTGVVTLATPWFSVRPEKFATDNRLLIARVISLLVLCGFILIATPIAASYLATQMLPAPPESIYEDVDFGAEGSMYRDPLSHHIAAAIFITLLLIPPIAVSLGIAWTFVHATFLRRVRSTEASFSQRILKHAGALGVATISMPPTVVLTASNDEASSTLRVVQWFSAVSREVLGRFSRLARSVCALHERLPTVLRIPLSVLLFAGFSVAVLWFGMVSVIEDDDGSLKVVSIGLGALSLVIGGFLGTSVLSGMSFGTFSFFAQMYCRFSVESSPRGVVTSALVDTTTRVDADKSWNGMLLNHSAIYLFDEGIEAICAAIRQLQSVNSTSN